ncbi:hypothetical protein Tco_1501443 [Tanacetum coccineum]
MIARKRPRPLPNDDSEDEHIKCLRIVTFNSTIDSEIMETKSFVSKLHKVSSPDRDYLVVYRVNGHFRAFNYLMEGDLKIMMESSTEENDQELKDGTIIYMLVERRYPLSKELLQRMLDLGLEVEEESTAALHLIISSWKLNETLFFLLFISDGIPKGIRDDPIKRLKKKGKSCHETRALLDFVGLKGDPEGEALGTTSQRQSELAIDGDYAINNEHTSREIERSDMPSESVFVRTQRPRFVSVRHCIYAACLPSSLCQDATAILKCRPSGVVHLKPRQSLGIMFGFWLLKEGDWVEEENEENSVFIGSVCVISWYIKLVFVLILAGIIVTDFINVIGCILVGLDDAVSERMVESENHSPRQPPQVDSANGQEPKASIFLCVFCRVTFDLACYEYYIRTRVRSFSSAKAKCRYNLSSNGYLS